MLKDDINPLSYLSTSLVHVERYMKIQSLLFAFNYVVALVSSTSTTFLFYLFDDYGVPIVYLLLYDLY